MRAAGGSVRPAAPPGPAPTASASPQSRDRTAAPADAALLWPSPAGDVLDTARVAIVGRDAPCASAAGVPLSVVCVARVPALAHLGQAMAEAWAATPVGLDVAVQGGGGAALLSVVDTMREHVSVLWAVVSTPEPYIPQALLRAMRVAARAAGVWWRLGAAAGGGLRVLLTRYSLGVPPVHGTNVIAARDAWLRTPCVWMARHGLAPGSAQVLPLWDAHARGALPRLARLPGGLDVARLLAPPTAWQRREPAGAWARPRPLGPDETLGMAHVAALTDGLRAVGGDLRSLPAALGGEYVAQPLALAHVLRGCPGDARLHQLACYGFRVPLQLGAVGQFDRAQRNRLRRAAARALGTSSPTGAFAAQVTTLVRQGRAVVFEFKAGLALLGEDAVLVSSTFEKDEGAKVRSISDLKASGVNRLCEPGLYPAVRYGRVVNEYFAEIVRLRRQYPRRRLLLLRVDVSGAFNLVRIDPCHAGLFAHVLEVEGTLCLFVPLCGMFGGNAFPAAFGIVADAIEGVVSRTRLDAPDFERHRLCAHVRSERRLDADDPSLPPLPGHAAPLPVVDGGAPRPTPLYVDDALLVAVDRSDADGVPETDRVLSAACAAVDTVLEAPPAGSAQGGCVSEKKLAGDEWTDEAAPALGMLVNTRTMRAELSAARMADLRQALVDVLAAGSQRALPLKVWQRLASLVGALAALLPGARHFAVPILEMLAGAGADGRPAMTPEALENVRWWLALLDDGAAAQVALYADLWRWDSRAPDAVVETDASRFGGGAVVLAGPRAGLCLRVPWPEWVVERFDLGHLDINDLEYAMSCLALRVVSGDEGVLRGLRVALLGDNASSVAWLLGRPARGAASNGLARDTVLWLLAEHVDVAPEHLAGVLNVAADALSRRDAASRIAGIGDRWGSSGAALLLPAELREVHELVATRCAAHGLPSPPTVFQVTPAAAPLAAVLGRLR